MTLKFLFVPAAICVWVTPARAQEFTMRRVAALEGELDPRINLPLGIYGDRVFLRSYAGELVVYDTTGSLLLTVTRPGQGPNEIGRIRDLAIIDNELWFTDPPNGRIDVMDPRSYEIVRTIPIPGFPWKIVQLEPDLLVGNFMFTTEDLIGMAWVTADQDLTVGIGFDEFGWRTSDSVSWIREGIALEGDLFSVPLYGRESNTVTRWSPAGMVRARFTFGQDWLDYDDIRYREARAVTPTQPPYSQFYNLSTDGQYLLLAGVKPDPKWRDHLKGREVKSGEGEDYYEYDKSSIWDGVIEVMTTEGRSVDRIEVEWVPEDLGNGWFLGIQYDPVTDLFGTYTLYHLE